MKRLVSVLALVALLVVLSAQAAHAGPIDWLEQWSGPGPYSSKVFLAATICPPQYSSANWFVPCFYVEHHRFRSVKDDNFPATKADLSDFGVAFKVRPQIEVGAGAGLIDFSTPQKSTAKFTVTFARVTVQPLRFIRPLSGRNTASRAAGILKVYLRETVLPGKLTAADFGINSSFSVENDKVTSLGLLLDFGELLRR